MEKLRLEPLEHRGQNCIAIVGSMNAAAYNAVRNFSGRQYSRTHGCWYIRFSPAQLTRLVSEIERYQEVEVSEAFQLAKSASHLALPEGYHEHLVRVRYSEATIKTYESQLRQFMMWLEPNTLEGLNDGVIERYLFHLARDRKVSISTQNTAINAIKFYLEKVHRGERKVYYVDRPMKEEKLPRVLSQEEIKGLIDATSNVKHRCMIMMLYATGIRISELLNLHWKDFDEERLQLFVDGGKGRKDRMTILSRSVIEYTKHYMKLYQPKVFLFEGPGGGKYSPGSVNKIIARGAIRAKITKAPTAHTLRHSFATHLLEHKTDIRYIQVLMGHDSSKTTERYTHVTTKGFSEIRSPLDNLNIDLSVPDSSNE